MKRREFLGLAAAAAGVAGCAHLPVAGRGKQNIFFTSAGKTCIIREDGTGLRPLELHAKDQVTWQPCGFYPDGKVLMLSMEERRDGPGRPFETYYRQTPTHIWIYDLERDSLREIVTKDRKAVFCTPALLLNEGRLLVQVVMEAGGQILNVAEDGSDAREFTKIGEGLPYGLSLSPDGKRVAFHLASPEGYQIHTSDPDGGNRVRVAAHPDWLYFAPIWSPDGQWLLYQACDYKNDPGHDWADLCIGRPDGSEHRVLTQGGAAWFAASYGPRDRKGGGSNVPVWSHDGKILFSRRLPDAKVAWEYQANRPDTDHFNRDFKPETARGGAEVGLMDPETGTVTSLTQSAPPVWDFRVNESPDARRIAFCRCATGESPALWVMNADGGGQRLLTRGLEDAGADHPRWQPLQD
jgi:Tol biopolymer transport system component